MSSHPAAAIVESNPSRRDFLRVLVSTVGFTPFLFDKETGCLDNLQHLAPRLILAGPMAPDRSLRLINSSKLADRGLPLILMCSHPSIADYIDTNGFTDVLVLGRTADPRLIKGAIRRLTRPGIKSANNGGPLIIGQHPALVRVKRLLPQLAPLREPVMLAGEDGTGKELVARALHALGGGNDRGFIRIDARQAEGPKATAKKGEDASGWDDALASVLASDPATLFVSGADRAGPRLQRFLLRLWEGTEGDRRFNGQGSEASVRFVMSFETGPEQAQHRERWPARLFHRFDGVRLHLPPLRRRVSDIPLLADFFLDQFCHQSGRVHYDLSGQAKAALCTYAWPGNVEELRHLVFRAVMQGSDAVVLEALDRSALPGLLPEISLAIEEMYETESVSALRSGGLGLEELALRGIRDRFVGDAEARVMRKVLDHTNWNRKKASKMLPESVAQSVLKSF